MTQQELDALAQLLQRVPLTIAEIMWVNQFLMRLRGEVADLPATKADTSTVQ